MEDEIENRGKLQKEHSCLVKRNEEFCLVWSGMLKKLEDRSGLFKKIRGYICHFVLLDQKNTPVQFISISLDKRP